ncbi:MAG: dicarboxylate/amino acid:cation symporter [Candidatus Omnitrophica bacterium]|nr:dicarboxylate/amino acid:cation symporter [Candidatus Omnitrophota bacterium]
MNTAENKARKKKHWLLSPWAIFAGMFLGCVLGLKFKGLANNLAVFGSIFLSLLQMCVIPIIITAVVSSLARLVGKRLSARFLSRFLFIILFGLIFASLVGLAAGLLGKPGVNLNDEARISIGHMVSQYDVDEVGNHASAAEGFSGFLKGAIPANVFSAFSQGDTLSILFFCILFGIALGLIRTPTGNVTVAFMEGLYDVFQTLFGWVMYALPFGLCVLFASQIAQVGPEIFRTLLKFIFVFYLTAILLMLVYNTLIWWRRGGPFFAPFLALRETLVVALGTASSHAAVPSSLLCLQDNLKVEKSVANLVVSLGASVHAQGKVMYFVLFIMFFAQMYGVPLGFQAILIVLSGAIFSSMGPGLGALVTLSLVLAALGVPSKPPIILLIAINPITHPILTVVSVFGNCAAAVLAEDPGVKAG